MIPALPLLALCAVLLGPCAAGAQEAPAAVRKESAPAIVDAVVEQPRPFGYQLGDLLEQRVLLEQAGAAVEPAVVPQRERLGAWFERRSARVHMDTDGRRWLVVQYQLVNVPQGLLQVSIPSWRLALKTVPPVQLRVKAWSVSASPLTPREGFDADEPQALRADREPAPPALAPQRAALRWCLAALVLELLAWLAWWRWRDRRAAVQQPFARALRELRGLDERAPQAWQVVHAAFDRAAGQVTQAGTLAVLFARSPHLAPARERIERFYAQSSERFFAGHLPDSAVSVRALCAELRRYEKRQEN